MAKKNKLNKNLGVIAVIAAAAIIFLMFFGTSSGATAKFSAAIGGRIGGTSSGRSGTGCTAQQQAAGGCAGPSGGSGLILNMLQVSVVESGGAGTITSDINGYNSNLGIKCGRPWINGIQQNYGYCNTYYEAGKTITLTATPDELSRFGSWIGCTSLANDPKKCTATISSTQSTPTKVTATFKAVASTGKYLHVKKTASYLDKTGTGIVTSNPDGYPGINCDSSCTSATGVFPKGTEVTLTATPTRGSGFARWVGCIPLTSNPLQCTIKVDSEETVTAIFSYDYDSISKTGKNIIKIDFPLGPDVQGYLSAISPNYAHIAADALLLIEVFRAHGYLNEYKIGHPKAWGYSGWGDCSTQSGGWEAANDFCQINLYDGADAPTNNPCYHESVDFVVYPWAVASYYPNVDEYGLIGGLCVGEICYDEYGDVPKDAWQGDIYETYGAGNGFTKVVCLKDPTYIQQSTKPTQIQSGDRTYSFVKP